ncbi:MAG: succinate dehydrogenase/fumarate reductase iron-sulfur subunit [Candidatus Aminicenantes bacterium]
MECVFRILRSDPSQDQTPHFQDFRYRSSARATVLEALMDIRNEQDSTLSFRYSCREAICGSCAMVINGRFDLACHTMVDSLGSSRIVIEPLPNMEVEKDLVVNMDPFWEAVYHVKPYIHPSQNPPAKGYRIEEKEMEKILQYINCIMCGCCYSACPVASRDERYLGPAALAKLWRLVKDPRDRRPFSEWSQVNTETGIWGCDTIFKCNEVCPKEVRPADGIEALRRKMIVEKFKRIFRSKS